MKLKLVFVIFVTKFIIRFFRIFRLGGTSFPGKLAKMLHPEILTSLAAGHRIIMVTGTNGKTTTTRMIGQILSENKIEYISNRSGANLVYGVITTFIESYRFLRKNICTALIEVDEAAFPKIASSIEPDCIVVTNFFRDQLDRYGEIYTTLKNMEKEISKLKKATLVLNADDSLCSYLGRSNSLNKIYYGFNASVNIKKNEFSNDDALYCIFCKTKYQYTNRIYGHLGGFRCPSCHYTHPETDITCSAVMELTDKYSFVEFFMKNSLKEQNPQHHKAKINLPGIYNIYNSLAAITCCYSMGLSAEKSVKVLEKFENSFGRMESINMPGININIILVKNPTGFNQVLEYISTNPQANQLALLINDNAADGKDISWLWDVEFERICPIQNRFEKIYTSGTRAEDMALRLKYAGFDTEKIAIVKDYELLLTDVVSSKSDAKNLCILPTYTAMLDIRRLLQKKVRLKEYWK